MPTSTDDEKTTAKERPNSGIEAALSSGQLRPAGNAQTRRCRDAR